MLFYCDCFITRNAVTLLLVDMPNGNNVMLDEVALYTILLNYSMPGAAGGVTVFLLGVHQGHYKNNHYVKKLILEICGACITATFLSPLISTDLNPPAISFLIGLAWVSIAHTMRTKITALVEAALGSTSEGKK